MKEIIDYLSLGQNPIVILVGLLLLYAMRDLGAKLKKIDHIDILVTQVGSLVTKVQELISSHDKQSHEVDSRIKGIELDIREIQNRLLRVETKQQGVHNG